MPTLVFRDNTLAYELGEHEPPEDAKQLVFLPGVSGTLQWWEYHLHELSRWHDTYAVEFPGHGESTGPACESIAAYRDCLGEFLTGMAIEPAILVGHSITAMAALSLAAHSPDLVEGLVLVSMYTKWRPKSADLNALAQAAEAGVPPVFDESLLSEEATEHMVRWAQRQNERSNAATALHDLNACANYDPAPDLARVTQPTLIVVGDSDPRIAPEEGYELANLMDNAHVVIIGDAGHLPMIEQRKAFAERVREFVATI